MDWYERTALELERDQQRRYRLAEKKDDWFDDAFERYNTHLIKKFRRSSQSYSEAGKAA